MTITEMDAHGRVLLPLEIRARLDLNAGDKLPIDHLGDGTIVKRRRRTPLQADGASKGAAA